MLVHFDEIPSSGRDYAWLVTAPDPGTDCTLDSPLKAYCHVRLSGQSELEVEGNIKGMVTLTCDRCLASYPFQLDSSFQVKAVVQSENGELHQADTTETGLEDCDTIECEARCLNLGELMRQQLFLALPDKRICSGDCAGLCPECGVNRNDECCECLQNAGGSPFAALANWTIKKIK